MLFDLLKMFFPICMLFRFFLLFGGNKCENAEKDIDQGTAKYTTLTNLLCPVFPDLATKSNISFADGKSSDGVEHRIR